MNKADSFTDLLPDYFVESVAKNRPSSAATADVADVLPPLLESPMVEEASLPTQYKINGVSDKVFKELRKSTVAATHVLDLHGYTVSDSHALLGQFLCRALSRQVQFITVIYGRGQHSKDNIAKLPNKVRHWLAQSRVVMAFCEPLQNKGAVLVKLKRHLK